MNITYRTRMMILGFGATIMVVAIFTLFFLNNKKMTAQLLADMHKIIIQSTDKEVELLTKSMASSLGELLKNIPNNQDKIALIATAIETFRFEDDKSGYFFVYQKTTPVAHPVRKDLIGQDLSQAKDANGVL